MNRQSILALAAGVLLASACATTSPTTAPGDAPVRAGAAPAPDPRVGLKAGMTDAGQAVWNMNLLSNTPSPAPFSQSVNSDLAFTGNYAIQGNFNGWQVWDISNPRAPVLKDGYVCPASQSDVSVYRNLLFVSGEDLSARIDCGTQGVQDTVSKDRLRGLRIFDISDIENPRNVGNVQTCRGSHTHSVLVDPRDRENVYVYISGSSRVRSPSELPGCIGLPDDPNSALFRIEVIKVPVSNPAAAAIVSSPRIFADLAAPPSHGEAPEDIAAAAKTAAEADALATAFYVMGPDGARSYCSRHAEVGFVMACPGTRTGSLEVHTSGLAEGSWQPLDEAPAIAPETGSLGRGMRDRAGHNRDAGGDEQAQT